MAIIKPRAKTSTGVATTDQIAANELQSNSADSTLMLRDGASGIVSFGPIDDASTASLVRTLSAKKIVDSYLPKALYDAHSILASTDDNTPVKLTVGEQTFVGRKTGGNIAALSASDARGILNVADGANAYVHPTFSTSSVNGSGATVIQDITLDNGHVSGLGTVTLDAAAVGAQAYDTTLATLSGKTVSTQGLVGLARAGADAGISSTGLLAYWRCDGTADYSGNGLNLSVIPSVVSGGKFGNCFKATNANPYWQTGASVLTAYTSADYTITEAFWYKAGSTAMLNGLFNNFGGSATHYLRQYANSIGWVTQGWGVSSNITGTAVISDGSWHHIVGKTVYWNDSGTHKMKRYAYVDGALAVSDADWLTLTSVPIITVIRGLLSPKTDVFAQMDEVAVWNRDLSDEEIEALYLAQSELTPVPYMSPFALTLLDDADAAAAISTLGLASVYQPLATILTNITGSSGAGFIKRDAAGAITIDTSTYSISTHTHAHNDTTSIQGGTTGQYNHLTNAQVSALHAANHALIDAVGHTVSGLTTGHFLKATGPTTYGFGAHGLVASDVGALASSHDASGVTAAKISNWDTAHGWGNHASANYVPKSLYNANTILAATNDNDPAVLEIAASRIVGRAASGGITALDATAARAILNVADGANAYTHPNHSGDVTSSGDGAQAIAAKAVTNAKMADMTASTFKARKTASTGVPEDVSAADVRTLLNVADGANAYTHPNHSGDVTSSGDGATTIANSAVSNAKMANMNQNTIKGRKTASAGAPEDLSASDVRGILNIADGANAYVHPNHTGDVTSVADGAQTIANSAVTNAKLANMAQSTFKARKTASTGAPEDVSVTDVKTLLAYTYTDVGAAASGHTHDYSAVFAPVSHASAATTYGAGDASKYGHVKLGATGGAQAYDATLAELSLVCDVQQNLCIRSEDTVAYPWSLYDMTKTLVSGGSPIGTDCYEYTVAKGGLNLRSYTSNLQDSTVYCLSYWVKVTSGTVGTIAHNGDAYWSTAINTTGLTDWTRVSATFTTTTTVRPYIDFEFASGAIGATLQIWGIQVNRGTIPFDYTPCASGYIVKTLMNGDQTIEGDLRVNGGSFTAGVTGTERGKIILANGSTAETPGCLKLLPGDGGVGCYLFSGDDDYPRWRDGSGEPDHDDGSAIMVGSRNLADVANAGTSRTNLGVGTGDSPQFTGLTLTGDAVVQGGQVTLGVSATECGILDLHQGSGLNTCGYVNLHAADGVENGYLWVDDSENLVYSTAEPSNGVGNNFDAGNLLVGTIKASKGKITAGGTGVAEARGEVLSTFSSGSTPGTLHVQSLSSGVNDGYYFVGANGEPRYHTSLPNNSSGKEISLAGHTHSGYGSGTLTKRYIPISLPNPSWASGEYPVISYTKVASAVSGVRPFGTSFIMPSDYNGEAVTLRVAYYVVAQPGTAIDWEYCLRCLGDGDSRTESLTYSDFVTVPTSIDEDSIYIDFITINPTTGLTANECCALNFQSDSTTAIYVMSISLEYTKS